jgi:hypothetical protein
MILGEKMTSKMKLIKDELKLIVELEHQELIELNKLVKETFQDIERTREELKLEDRINLNLKFINYILKRIHKKINEIIELSKNLDEDGITEINHRIKSILSDLVELDDKYLPVVKKGLDEISKTDQKKSGFFKQFENELLKYENIIGKLKLMFDITEMSIEDLTKIDDIKINDIQTELKKS